MNETTEAQQWASLAPADMLAFSVYLPGRGNALTIDRDGEIALRLCVPGSDRRAVLALVDQLGAGDGQMVRLVAVRDGAP
jgi:hypothetical protein